MNASQLWGNMDLAGRLANPIDTAERLHISNQNTSDINYCLRNALVGYECSMTYTGLDRVEVELWNNYHDAGANLCHSPMRRMSLRVQGIDTAHINRQFFSACLRDIEAVGNGLNDNILFTRLAFYYQNHYMSVEELSGESSPMVLYSAPDSVDVLPYRVGRFRLNDATPQRPHSFRRLLIVAMTEMAHHMASVVWQVEGRTPQDILDYLGGNP